MIGFALVPIIGFYLMEAFEHNALAEVRQEAQLFNILIFELIAWTLYLLIGRMALALRIELIIALVFGITNHYDGIPIDTVCSMGSAFREDSGECRWQL